MSGLVPVTVTIFVVTHGTEAPPAPWKHIDGKKYRAQYTLPVYASDRGVHVTGAVDKFLQEYNMQAVAAGASVELHRDKGHSGGGVYVTEAEKKRVRGLTAAMIDSLAEQQKGLMAAAAMAAPSGWIPRAFASAPPPHPRIATIAAENLPGTPFKKGYFYATQQAAAENRNAQMAAMMHGLSVNGGK